MSEVVEKVLPALKHLNESERAELASILLHSLHAPETEIESEEAFDLKLERRFEEIRSGKVKGIPAEEVYAKLRSRRNRSEATRETTMNSLLDHLPPEIAAQISIEWRNNELEYWRQRDQLMEKFDGQWIGFADGTVIASGTSAVEVLHSVGPVSPHAFLICVGRENEPTRMRRTSFPYDATYRPEPLPIVDVEFRSSSGDVGITMNRVIPDTGADASVLPWSDCQLLQLNPTQGFPGLMGGVGGASSGTLLFWIWAVLDGAEHPCRLQVDFAGNERILGRDVLNRLEILFRGPSQEVVINP